MRVHRHIHCATAKGVTTREETFLGRTYLIAPVVSMVQGVRTPGNIGEPELALMSEFDKTLTQWNGRPIVLNHPHNADDEAETANIPTMYDEYACGFIFNSVIDGDKLKQEVWLDVERCEEKGGEFQEALDLMRDGEVMNVSTGLFCDAIAKRGTYQGETYKAVWRNITPDHLALLPNMLGACSVADGCGTPRENAVKAETVEAFPVVAKLATESTVKPMDFRFNSLSIDDLTSVAKGDIANSTLPLKGNKRKLKTETSKDHDNCNCESKLNCQCNNPTNNSVEVSIKARRPSFAGTENGSWANVDHSIQAFVTSYNEHNLNSREVVTESEGKIDISKLSNGCKRWIASKSLLGNSSASSHDGLLQFPVVNPKTLKLNERALRSVIGGRGQLALSTLTAETVQSAREQAIKLLDKEFGIEIETELKEQEQKIKQNMGEFTAKVVENSSGISDADLRYSIQAAMDESGLSGFIMAVFADSFVYSDWWEGGMYEAKYSADDSGNVTIDPESVSEVRPSTSYVPVSAKVNQTEIENKGNETMPENKPGANASEQPTNTQVVSLKDNSALTIEQLLAEIPPHLKAKVNSALTEQSKRTNAMIEKIMVNKNNEYTRDELVAMDDNAVAKLFKMAGESLETDPSRSPQAVIENKNERVDHSLNAGVTRTHAAEVVDDKDKNVAPVAPSIMETFSKEPRAARFANGGRLN